MLLNYRHSREFLSLFSSMRGIHPSQVDGKYLKAPVPLDRALALCMQKAMPLPEDLRTITLMRSCWKSWFSQSLWLDCWPERLDKRGTLFLRVPNPIVKQKLQFHKTLLISRLNQLLKHAYVKEICAWIR